MKKFLFNKNLNYIISLKNKNINEYLWRSCWVFLNSWDGSPLAIGGWAGTQPRSPKTPMILFYWVPKIILSTSQQIIILTIFGRNY